MFLHAYKISFTHPETNKVIQLQAALPKDCESFLQSLLAEENTV
jgi:23S rRNA pseudouridine955/2504/2580 synthase